MHVPVHRVVADVTERVIARSRETRTAYLSRISQAAAERGGRPTRADLGCSNLAHAVASCGGSDRVALAGDSAVSIGIVTSYNDMLSAHAPYETYPQQIKETARSIGGVARVAGGVPAMCDGITQGRAGMELSLFSRDVIAMSAAIALSHDAFDAALMLGVCDKIVPGLVAGALAFGHLPTAMVPAGPMSSGLPNAEKAAVRRAHADGKVGREDLLAAEVASYHSPGTCTFYGTANSNQLLMDVMGLHLPGAAFVHPDSPLRAALTDAATRRVAEIASGDGVYGIGDIVDEKVVVNGVVALLATGGSTNHTMHLVTMAAAAGVQLTWEDFDDLSRGRPAAGPHVPQRPRRREPLPRRRRHAVPRRHAGRRRAAARGRADPGRPRAEPLPADAGAGRERRAGLAATCDPVTGNPDVLRPVAEAFEPDGGLRMLSGTLGNAVMKVSSVAAEHRVIEAPARVFTDQVGFLTAFSRRELDRDVVVVIRDQGPSANGMPELHALTPSLGVLQKRGHQVALLTDGRMSGASGTIPAAIHVTPESVHGGPISRLRDGDVVRLDADAGTLDVLVDPEEWEGRTPALPSHQDTSGTGRELFAAFRSRRRPRRPGRPRLRPGTHRPSPTCRRPDDRRTRPAADGRRAPRRSAPSCPSSSSTTSSRRCRWPGRSRAAASASSRSRCAPPPASVRSSAVAAEVPEILTGAGTVTTPEEAEAVRRAGAQFIVTPGLTAPAAGGGAGHRAPGAGRVVHAHRDDAPGRAGAHGDEVLPGRGQWRAALPVGGRRPDARAAVLPDRWHLDGQRRRLPRAAQRRLRRRVVAHAEGRRGRGGLGAHRGPRPRGRGAARLSRPALGGARAAGLRGWSCGPRGRAGQGTARELRLEAGVRWTSRTCSRAAVTAVDCGSPLPSGLAPRGAPVDSAG